MEDFSRKERARQEVLLLKRRVVVVGHLSLGDIRNLFQAD